MKNKYNEVEVKDNMKVDSEDNEENTQPKEKKELKKVVSTQPKKMKRSLISRLAVGILGPEGLPSIGSYVNEEIVKPAIKNIIVDAVTSGINRLIYGDNQPRTGGGRSVHSSHRSGYTPRTNYASRYPNAQPEPRDRLVSPRSSRYGVDEYVIEERFDAAHVLTSLTEQADMYDNVSVADYYDLIGVPTQFTDNSYGWTHESIIQASILPVRGGYVIKFPSVEVIG